MIPKIKLKSGIEIPVLSFGPGGIGYSPRQPKKYGRLLNLYHRVYNKFVC